MSARDKKHSRSHLFASDVDNLLSKRLKPNDYPLVFDLYRKPVFDESIRKEEYRSYTPFIKSFNCSDVIEFSINQVDSYFAMSDTLLSIKGKLVVEGDATAAAGVSLTPNFGAFLFDSCSYSESSREIETVRDPGILSTVRGMLCYDEDDSKHLSIAGWNYPNQPFMNGADKTFHLLIPLKHIFNIFNDYPMVTSGRQTIRLVRARNDNDCIIVTNATTVAKISIDSMELKIKHIYPNDIIKEQLLKTMSTDKPILKPFRKWELHELPTVTQNSKREIWAVKNTTSVERPRYVIVLFQTEKRDKLTADPTAFDHSNILSIRLSLNGDFWPNERMQTDFAKNDYVDAYFKYAQFYPSYTNSVIRSKQPLLNYTSFKGHALFVIDCSKQEESMKSSTVDVRLEIEATAGFKANTKVYAIIVHDSLIEYFPLSEVVKNLM